MERKIKLTEKETPIMNLLWEKGPMFVREVVAAYPEPRPHFNTISTQIRILEDKGFVSHNVVGGAFQYYAVVGREQFIERSFSDIVRSFFNYSRVSFFTFYVNCFKWSIKTLLFSE